MTRHAASVTSIRITRDQIYFLDRFRAQVNRDTGCRMPRAAVLQALLETIRAASIDLSGVSSEADLTKRLCELSGRPPDEDRR